MKKLMFVAAAALCATVGASALESANVVGYDQVGLRFGSKGAGASFVPTSGAATIDIQDIKVSGYEESSVAQVTLQTLDAYGRTVQTYTWYDFEDEGDKFYGWFDSNDELVEGVTFAPGEGLYAGAPDATFSLQSAGQVPTSDIAVQLRFGSKHCVNPTPVTLDLQSIWISGYSDSSVAEVTAQTLDEYGRTLQTYTWYDFEDEGDTFYGWFNSDDELVQNVTLAPGTSFYFGAPSAAFYVNFPGVTL